MKTILHVLNIKRLLGWAAYCTFWGYNGIFITLICFGLIPMEINRFIDEIQRGLLSPLVAGFVIFGGLVPILTCIFGFVKLRHSPRGLLALLFGVEGPALLVTLVSAAAERTLTTPVTLILIGLLLGAAGQIMSEILRDREINSVGRLGLILINTIGAVTGIYLAVLLSFFVLPWLNLLADIVIREGIFADIYRALTHLRPVRVLGMLLALASGFLVLGIPVGLVSLPVARIIRDATYFCRQGSGTAALLTIALTGTGSALLLSIMAQQPQLGAFKATDHAPSTDADRRAWLAQAEDIQEGLLNTYLWHHRYVGSDRGLNAVDDTYRWAGYSDEEARHVQELFNQWARPFLFDDSAREMRESEASQRYKSYFDASLQRQANVQIQNAMQHVAPWQRRGGARISDINARRVRLVSQEITVHPKDKYADIEIHDAYRSEVLEESEIRIGFALPPSAVLTGLWMGPSAKRSEAFPFVIAPKGAARKVYEAQVRRRIDPALLEQVGPQQYSLRIFPIPGTRQTSGAPVVHVWLTYQALPGPQGWPVPKVLQLQNAYFDDEAPRTINGAPVQIQGWMPERLHSEVSPEAWNTRLASDQSLYGIPVQNEPTPVTGQRIALVLDRSYSMRMVEPQLQATLKTIRELLSPANTIDVLLTSAEVRGEAPRLKPLAEVGPQDLLAFGGHGSQLLFEQADQYLSGYDAIVLITDSGDSVLDVPGQARASCCPLYLLSLNGFATSLSDNLTQSLLRSGGALVQDLADLMHRLHLNRRPMPGSEDRQFVGLSQGWAFFLGPHPTMPQSDDAGLLPLAAAWFIRRHTANPEKANLKNLDRLHEMAQRATIVSPYSSMLVLINDAQRAQLEAANRADDRFERGVHASDDEPLPHPATLDGNLQGTPEPSSWALLALAAAGAIRRRSKNRRGPPRLSSETV